MEDVKCQQDHQSQWSVLKVKLKKFSCRELFHVQTKDVKENSKARMQLLSTLQMEDVKRQQDHQSQWLVLKVKLKKFSRRELFHVQTKDVKENSKARLQLPSTLQMEDVSIEVTYR